MSWAGGIVLDETFEWYLCAEGYEWVDAIQFGVEEDYDEVERFLVARDPKGEPRKTYHPLREHRALFREFVAAGKDREAIRAFANRFGFFGPYVLVSRPPHDWPL